MDPIAFAISEKIGALAARSMLYELAANPKPGLVDRNNSGAHDDMDFFTFLDSAVALAPYFVDFAVIGSDTNSLPPGEAMKPLRRKGVEAERAMFAATGGVNTHKGMIFSMGLICGAAGRLAAACGSLEPERICSLAGEICRGVCEEDFKSVLDKSEHTKGERIYIEYGLKGVRGEAESGFSTVMRVSLPCYTDCLAKGASENDALVQALLCLISSVQDTNIISRHDAAASSYVMRRAGQALCAGGVFSAWGRCEIEKMDEEFIERKISPGGSADLLAITYFLANVRKFGR